MERKALSVDAVINLYFRTIVAAVRLLRCGADPSSVSLPPPDPRMIVGPAIDTGLVFGVVPRLAIQIKSKLSMNGQEASTELLFLNVDPSKGRAHQLLVSLRYEGATEVWSLFLPCNKDAERLMRDALQITQVRGDAQDEAVAVSSYDDAEAIARRLFSLLRQCSPELLGALDAEAHHPSAT